MHRGWWRWLALALWAGSWGCFDVAAPPEPQCEEPDDCEEGWVCSNTGFCMQPDVEPPLPDADVEDIPDEAADLDPNCRPTSPIDDRCDGIDSDCDGRDGEDAQPPPELIVPCAPTDLPPAHHAGECIASTEWRCDSGSWVCVGSRAPADEVCDGLDNDCDGVDDLADPDLKGLPCAPEDEATCPDGRLVCERVGDSFAPRCRGSDEVCDGMDNDCDGVADEGEGEGPLERSCASAQGDCGSGTETCRDGSWGECSGEAIGAEVCDGRDNDCDGVTDNGMPTVVDPMAAPNCDARDQSGVCRRGQLLCQAGAPVCVSLGPGPGVDDDCDGEDEDCDGHFDEHFPQDACDTGRLGICAVGQWQCVGAVQTCRPSEGPLPIDVCGTGLDEDCDGESDEPVIDYDCVARDGQGTLYSGRCECAEGRIILCDGGPSRLYAPFEVEDAEDNDCDGQTDELPLPGQAEQ